MADWPEDRHGFIVFYHDGRDGTEVRSEDALWLDLPTIEERIRDVLSHPLNYFGLVDRFDATLQFMAFGGDSPIRVEIPDPTRNGSMATYATLEECLAWVRAAGPSLAELDIPDMEFESWR